MSQYREPAVAVTLDDTLYGLPEFYNNRIMLTNNAVLEEAGLSPDDVDTSDWAGLSNLAKATAVVDGGTVTRIGFDPKIPEFLPLWAKANGVDLLSEDGTEANLDDPAVVEALEYTVSLIEAQGGWGRSSPSATRGTSSVRRTSSRPTSSAHSRWRTGISTC